MVSLKEAIQSAEVIKCASTSSQAALASYAVLKNYRKGDHLFFDKDDVDYLYIVAKGRASLYKVNSLGDKKVIFVYGVGKMLNEVMLQDLPASINCELVEDAAILMLPIKQFLKVMEQDSGLAKAVIDSMALKIRRLYRQLKNTTNTINGEKKLAAKLYKLAIDFGTPVGRYGNIQINMKLTVTYLAEMLGSKRETVSRQMKILIEENLISYQKSQVIVNNMEDLSHYFRTS